MTAQLPQQIEQAPVTFVTLFAYVALGVLTNPFEPDRLALVRYGAEVPILVQDGDWWRLLTHAYLHYGIFHLFVNCYALWLFGPLLERTIGSVRFLLLYVVTAISGGVVATMFAPPFQSAVGGSGALFGMMGAMLALTARLGRTRLGFLQHHFARYLMTMIAANLALGFMIPVVSNSAHIGGLISGFVLVYVFLDTGRERVDAVGRALQAGFAALFLALIAYTVVPVLRWDYQLKRSLTASSSETRQAFSRALRLADPADIAIFPAGCESLGPRGEALRRSWFR